MAVIKNSTLIPTVILFAVLSISACSGTSPSKSDAQCREVNAEGEALPTDNYSSCVTVLHERAAPVCGSRIQVDDVWVVDMETPEQERESLLEQAGPYVLMNETPVAIRSRGSKVQTVLRAKKVAADGGCNLLLLGPTQTVEVRANAHPFNSRDTGGIERYLLVKLAVRQD